MPPTKKIKTENPLNILSPHILTSEESLKQSYASATPFPHGRMESMFQDGFLEKVLEEVKSTTKVTFKESDLFRVYQSVDLGNLPEGSPMALELPSLMDLKRSIYSQEFRHFMERVVGIPKGTLTEEVDCAANCHAGGCHLLCHDDVIGTRKVSYIIYLTEKGWTKEEGGCLEMYESELDTLQRRVPKPAPSCSILPIFNTMAYFVVSPGQSFHSVQEVFGERPRLSIQGWYHAKETPENMEEATLSRLKSTQKGEDTEGDFAPFVADDMDEESLSAKDVEYLSTYMNATYLMEASMKEIQARFVENSSVQLRAFILPRWLDKVSQTTAKEDEKLGKGRPSLDYEEGVHKDWKIVGPAHKQRFLEYTGTSSGDLAGPVLARLRHELLESIAFARYLKCITSLEMPIGHRGRVRRFRPGMDYTVAHYGILTTQSVLDATLCFASGKGEQCLVDEETGDLIGSDDDAIWESDDCGGFECYIAAESDGDEANSEAADEYNEEDDSALLSVSASNNTLSLVYRDPGTMRFVKYVGCRAPSSRWDLSMEYEVEDTGDDLESNDECINLEDEGKDENEE